MAIDHDSFERLVQDCAVRCDAKGALGVSHPEVSMRASCCQLIIGRELVGRG